MFKSVSYTLAVSGIKGLSLFIVPKFRVNDDGSIGEWNDVTTTGIEHKMGLKAQATALLGFGENDGCFGIRMGPPPDAQGRSQGLAMMFHMMNESRIGTGHNANTQAAVAYAFASQYARERIQGRHFGVRDAGRVPIVEHEDVRRMLLDMKAHTEGIRAMIFKGFYYLDLQAHSADRAKATVLTKVKFLEPDERILPEMSAKVAFLSRSLEPSERQARLAVPQDALVTVNGQKYAFLIQGNRVKRVEVTMGPNRENLVEIAGGLKEGDKVALKPPASLKDGSRIKVKES